MAAETLLVIVDADTLAGWRRPTASLEQLDRAVEDLRAQEPAATVAVVGDPSLKWSLPESEHPAIEERIVSGRVVFAPAGSIGGHVGFMAEIARRARQLGMRPVAVTDRAVPDCPVARISRPADRFVFDIAGAATPTVVAATTTHRRRRPRAG